MASTRKLDNALIGAAGVHFVAAELSLRGLIALPTIRNAPGIDLVVVNPSGSWHANVQVKTSQYKVNYWPISTKYPSYHGPSNFYAFVRYLAAESRFEAFLESADQVIRDADRAIAEEKEKGHKEWAPWWPLPYDQEGIARVKQQWEDFGRDR